MQKLELFEKGVEIIDRFYHHNKRLLKPYSVHHATFDNRGLYEPPTQKIFINLANCRTPVVVPGYAWSFPGNKSDITPIGVLAHEMGHHCHYSLTRTDWKILMLKAREVREVESPVTSYEPNAGEVIAEAFRLFILNPHLLLVGRPYRYSMISKLGFKPIEKKSWKQILKDAHPRIIQANEKWIEK